MAHINKPVFINPSHGNTGEPPIAGNIARPAVNMYQYLKNWLQNQQLFTFVNALGDSVASGETSSFYVMLHNAPKDDTSNPERELLGGLMPWSINASVGTPAKIEWIHGGSTEELFSTVSDKEEATPAWSDIIKLGSSGAEKFQYTPQGSGLWTYGELKLTGIQAASVGVWPGPDWTLTDNQAKVLASNLAAGTYIMGYDGSSNSLGALIQSPGGDTITEWALDTLERNATVCLFQWGHPVGVWIDDSSGVAYYTVGGSGCTCKVQVPAIRSYASNEIEVYPTVVCSATLNSGTAYVQITASDSGDTWELPITNEAVTLYDYTDASNDTLTLSTDVEEEITIEIKPSTGGEILLHSVALWGHLFDA